MKLFQRLFLAAILSGLVAGAAMSIIQQWRIAPIILAAEVYEDQEPAAGHMQGDAAATTAMPAGHEHEADGWKPANGLERIGYTVLADLLAAAGFGLLLAAVSVLGGLPVTAANGVLWGLAGFLVFHLAPAFGLPPELPGMPAADLGARQLWWWGTAVATAAALFGIAKFRNWPAIGIGAVLILAPHIVGAPPIPETPSAVPAHLATSFAASALTAAAVFWMLLGPLYGYLFARLGEVRVSAVRRAAA